MRASRPPALAANDSAGPPALTPEQVGHARYLLTRPENTIASISRLLGVSRATIHTNVPELRHGRTALQFRWGSHRLRTNPIRQRGMTN